MIPNNRTCSICNGTGFIRGQYQPDDAENYKCPFCDGERQINADEKMLAIIASKKAVIVYESYKDWSEILDKLGLKQIITCSGFSGAVFLRNTQIMYYEGGLKKLLEDEEDEFKIELQSKIHQLTSVLSKKYHKKTCSNCGGT